MVMAGSTACDRASAAKPGVKLGTEPTVQAPLSGNQRKVKARI